MTVSMSEIETAVLLVFIEYLPFSSENTDERGMIFVL